MSRVHAAGHAQPRWGANTSAHGQQGAQAAMQVLTNLLAPTTRGWEPCTRDVDPGSTGAVYCSTVNCQEAPRL